MLRDGEMNGMLLACRGPDSESAWFPTGLQAVPIADPNWAHDKGSDDWKRVHLITCIKEGLTKSRAK